MNRRERLCLLLLSLGLLLAFALALDLGVSDLGLADALGEWRRSESGLASVVVWEIRLPRALLAVLVGASLGMAGAAMQGLLRNPLAEPGVLGVSSGAALGAVLVLYFGLAAAGSWWLPMAAMVGAFVALLLVYLLAGSGTSVLGLILAGVAINAMAGALIALALNFAPSLFAFQEIVFWLMGSLANRNLTHLQLAAPFVLLGCLLMWSRGRFLDALSLGEESARSLGFDAVRERLLILLGLALAVGASVAVSGNIGFVGLVVPHLLRPVMSQRPGRLLLASALGGALLVLLADLLVRQLDVARELKLGVVTSLVGGPFFLYLLLHSKKRWI
jgi:iron complex transport system permease protein